MKDIVIKGSYAYCFISPVLRKKKYNAVLQITMGSKKIYINEENVVYCNIVKKESDIKLIGTMISSLMWGHIAGDTGRVYANIDAPRKYTYYIEMEFADGKSSYVKVGETIKHIIEENFDLKEYALGIGNTKCNFNKYAISEEEKRLRKNATAINKKLLAIIFILLITLISLKICINIYDRGYVFSNTAENIENQEVTKSEKLEEESKVWGYYEDTKEAMGLLTDELVNSEDSELESMEKIAGEIETKADSMREYVTELERNDHNEKYYSACQEYITMCRIAAENIKEYTQDNDTEHLEIAVESLKNGEKSAENISEYRKDCLKGIGCSDEEIERIVGEKEN